jgi:cytidylate kinase
MALKPGKGLPQNPLLITLDGPAGSGKSTVARLLAERLGLPCLDTGAMYRVVAWALKEENKEHLKGESLKRFLEDLDFTIEGSGPGQKVWFRGKDIAEAIRKPEISILASAVSKKEEVREILAEKQRAWGRKGGLVAEGRDMGTVVFPQAPYKFFLDAPLEVRARRRYAELIQKGEKVTLEEVCREMERRDRQDRERELAPLLRAPDALLVDTSSLSPEEVVDLLYRRILSGGEEGITEENPNRR